ncbi:EamA family transporter RarD [Desulfopila sp. IMCC35006]|uniref:EamA family transporter RarD n=1 Tax=Desulfopila sp. IMCC35006 TaxID=2569542 RepID=UPI00197AF146|nr:EamA family transporter RarD [Desulfopila sp. IMCC35006]
MINFAGLMAAAGAFIIWGVLPAYWKLLQQVPAYEILCHRMSWSLVLTLGLVFLTGRRAIFRQALKDRQNLITFTTTGLLLALNWLLYIWAVNAGFIVEASLGYFINPLINVFFGMIFFQEKMRPIQWFALLLAGLGVLYLTFYYGRFPWIALVLAVSFGLYGLLHKKNSLGALDALCLETGVLFLPAAAVLIGLAWKGGGSFGRIDLSGTLLLVGTGFITTVPLLLFGYAAQKIPLSTLGLMQYLAPSINLLLGIYIYGEEFPPARMVGFMLIWSALVIFMAENLLRHFRNKKKVLSVAGPAENI